MWRGERGSSSSAYQLFRAYVHTYPRKRVQLPEPKSDTERTNLGLPLREPWFEVKPFDEKKMRFVLSLKDTLQAQPKQRIEIADLSNLRQALDVLRQGKQRKMTTYVRRFPAAFTLRTYYTPKNKKKTWCGFSTDALKLLEEEGRIFQASEALLVQKLCKVLMISMKNRLPIATLDQVRQSLGLPVDYKESLVKKYPDVFRLKERKGFLYLELKEWDESLAITVFEKNTQEGKYVKQPKKKRTDRVTIEENEQETLCEEDPKQSFLSKEEEDDALLTKQGNQSQKEVLSAMHGQEEREEMVIEDEGDVCDEQSSENTVKLNAEGFGIDIGKDGQLQAGSASCENKTKGDEKQLQGMSENLPCLQFSWILKRGKKLKGTREAEIESFQSLPYISPYRNSRELVLPPHKTLQTDKFLVGLIHEFLSLTLEKRATVQQMELFRRPYRLPHDILQFLLQYDGIFYVAKGTTKAHIFLKEGYKEFDLLEKEPLLLWQERFLELAFSSPKPKERTASEEPLSQDAESFSEEE